MTGPTDDSCDQESNLIQSPAPVENTLVLEGNSFDRGGQRW